MEKFNLTDNMYQINLYLNGLMVPEQMIYFENEVRSNIKLREQVELIKIGKLSQHLTFQEQFSGILQEMNATSYSLEDIVVESGKKRLDYSESGFVLRYKQVTSFISVFIVILISGLVINNHLKESLVQDQARLLIQNSKGISTKIPDLLAQGVKAFLDSDYEKAVEVLKGVEIKTTLYPESRLFGISKESQFTVSQVESYRYLYLGLTYLFQKEFDLAIHTFKRVEKPLDSEAEWYTALAFLESKQKDESIKLLQKISNSPFNKYRKAAARLLPVVTDYW